MAELIKKEKKFLLIPPDLEKDFEEQVMSAYFDSHRLDLHHIADLTDDFCVYAYSFEQTGNPYTLVDDPKKTFKDFQDISDRYFNELVSDIFEVLRFYNIFHAWDDIGGDYDYELISPSILPIVEVW